MSGEERRNHLYIEIGLNYRRLAHVMSAGFLATIVTGLVLVATLPFSTGYGYNGYYNQSFPFLVLFITFTVLIFIATRKVLKSLHELGSSEGIPQLVDLSRVQSRSSRLNLAGALAVASLLSVYYGMERFVYMAYSSDYALLGQYMSQLYLLFPVALGIACVFTLLTTRSDYKTWKGLGVYLDDMVPDSLAFLREMGVSMALKSQQVGFALGIILIPVTVFVSIALSMLAFPPMAFPQFMMSAGIVSGLLGGTSFVLFIITSSNFLKAQYRIGNCFKKVGTGDLHDRRRPGKRVPGREPTGAGTKPKKYCSNCAQKLPEMENPRYCPSCGDEITA